MTSFLYYNPSISSRAATIFLWGRLATCGRLSIGLPPCGAGNPACSRLSRRLSVSRASQPKERPA
jgi:hypothetical protein